VTIDPTGALPVVPDTALPADVRSGSNDDKQTYKAALAFERQLLTQLLQGLDTSGSDDSSDNSDDADGGSVMDGTDAATNTYKQQLPDQTADAVINGGGTGLAENLYRALKEQS
jgi:Rod binding domain-containing protein